MIKIAVVILIVGVVIVSSIAIIRYDPFSGTPMGYGSFSGAPFLTLTATFDNKSPQADFPFGYASPNLWGWARGGGNATMTLYTNSSIKFTTNFQPFEGSLAIFGYPSLHFTYGLPMPLNRVYKDMLSSYVSFTIKKDNGLWNDIAYDMFLGENGVLQDEVEIMLIDNIGTNISVGQTTFLLPLTINGIEKEVNWTLDVGKSASGDFPAYTFVTPFIKAENS
ncbi:MAG: hypothetical protein ACP5UZ_09080, partial [Thermoplasmata archaeon]